MAGDEDISDQTVVDKVDALVMRLNVVRAELTRADASFTRENLNAALQELQHASAAVDQIRKDLGTQLRVLDRQ
jgi:flagellin-like hook-associated protein FlgL